MAPLARFRRPRLRLTTFDVSGDTRVGIVGESHYQEALAAIAGPKRAGGVRVPVTAVLVPEPDNPYDSNAIAVHVEGGDKVGHLSRDDALAYGGLTSACTAAGASACCEAIVLGADARRDTQYCVWLHIQPPEWRPAD